MYRHALICTIVYRAELLAEHEVTMDELAANSEGQPFEMWNEDKLSEVIDVPVPTIRSWRSRGGGPPFIKIGRKVKYRPTSVWKWLEEQERTVDADG